MTPKRTKYSWSSSNLGSISAINRKYWKIVQNNKISWTISRFWLNFGFRLNQTSPSTNFMDITNILFNLTTAQRLRRYSLLPVYFLKIFIKVTSELCSLYRSQSFSLPLWEVSGCPFQKKDKDYTVSKVPCLLTRWWLLLFNLHFHLLTTALLIRGIAFCCYNLVWKLL